ncbi:ATP-binding protein [Odoribacter sp. OttesenSCG-928-L07]|nr:ATP-binding protein [Odoribacter sp. OttesenSCG-928-L07]MDL2239899.1 ATP-binding protein [Bacteroidales bacterium OttesenSCG-928-L14]MDL2241208.1 ATP-binding protein [Bacteroidales bacterium OttesenSCG-928-K22]
MKQKEIIQNNESAEKQPSKRSNKTLLQHIENIIELVEDSYLSDEFYKKAKESINFVANKMNITNNQTILFSVFIEKHHQHRIEIKDIARFIGCKNVKILSLTNDIEELIKRRLIRFRHYEDSSYYISDDVITALKQNKNYETQSISNLDIHSLFIHLDRLFNEREEKEISYENLIYELNELIEENQSLEFCKRIKEFQEIYNNERQVAILLAFCHLFINEDDDYIGFHNFEYIFEGKSLIRQLKQSFRTRQSRLFTDNIIENCNEDGFGNSDYFKLTESTKEKLFTELDIIIKPEEENKKGLILCNEIKSKELFFNERVNNQLSQLSSLLVEDNFTSVQKRLENNGMRKGFACLFYGSPGTGKTETVYQLARATGRDIMQVDISTAKTCWYGESQKLVKGIFDKYKKHLASCKTAPILLFNEADGILTKRKDGNSSVDQTENAIQNIILQEMETLEGIMIATTNLTQNLDSAFERRFLFKIEFEKPDIEAKARIWQAMLPSLTNLESCELAKEYNFSGGQIENIIRKYTIDSILNDEKPSIEKIRSFCRNENLNNDNQHKRIGY